MSAIASFIRFPKSVLRGLREAAVPEDESLGGESDYFYDFIDENGEELEFYGSGYTIVTLLSFLDENGVKLMKSEYDDLVRYMYEKREELCFVFTSSHRSEYCEKLDRNAFSESMLRDYYNKFNATNETEIGTAMLEGIQCIRESLESIDDDSVVYLRIG